MTDVIVKFYIDGDFTPEDFVYGLEVGGADVTFQRQTYDHERNAEQVEYLVEYENKAGEQ